MASRLEVGFTILLLCSFFAGCSNVDTCEVPLTQLGAELKQLVISRLHEQDIPSVIRSDGTICVDYDDAQHAAVVLGEVVQELIPRETSQTMDEEVQNRVLIRLKQNGIPFTVQQLDRHNYIVWDEAHNSAIRKVIEEEFRRHGEINLESN